jgi:hypothetical protein
VLVLEFVQLGAVFQLGFQVRVVKLGCASRVVQSGGRVLWISWIPFLPPHHVGESTRKGFN